MKIFGPSLIATIAFYCFYCSFSFADGKVKTQESTVLKESDESLEEIFTKAFEAEDPFEVLRSEVITRCKFYGLDTHSYVNSFSVRIVHNCMLLLHELILMEEKDLRQYCSKASLDSLSKWKRKEYLKFSFVDFIRAFSGAEGFTELQRDEICNKSIGKLLRWKGYIADTIEMKGEGKHSYLRVEFAPIRRAKSEVPRAFIFFSSYEQKDKLLKYTFNDEIAFEGRFVGEFFATSFRSPLKLNHELKEETIRKAKAIDNATPLEVEFIKLFSDPEFEFAPRFLFVNGRIVEGEQESLPKIKLASPEGKTSEK